MKIAVYCSSMDNLPDNWQEGARAVGTWIGKNKFQLVYGGVDAGLMCVAARACKNAGGTVVGIVPTRRANQASPFNDVRVPTADLNDRKGVMQLLSDVFVVLPGGYGTLDEFAASFGYINFTMRRDKRVILFNPDGIFDPLLAQLKLFVEHGLMTTAPLEALIVATTVDQLIEALDQRKKQHSQQQKHK